MGGGGCPRRFHATNQRCILPLINCSSVFPVSSAECEHRFSHLNTIVSEIPHSTNLTFIKIHGPSVQNWNPKEYVISWYNAPSDSNGQIKLVASNTNNVNENSMKILMNDFKQNAACTNIKWKSDYWNHLLINMSTSTQAIAAETEILVRYGIEGFTFWNHAPPSMCRRPYT